ncbi:MULTISPECIES: maleylpyruvate isomerase family mycothiol-dependent enzyme [Streptomyces]|uniref:Putative Actinobacterial protein n=1 Tax=Streptomyces chartreusis NRRL 3882 TaxID=1079985 RepID=A0A2N9BF77_STRCX|nr:MULTISPECIES: maleylpyruvate isomerase family mycothiol-dependent enzyme [Streptomyces]MYS95410.1 maleylpyruvate isomerase family mycothiol-dependent enzyme [Streptomyces sp. SID5464]SOR82012.1 putative Actinobacterial protein [Streptomyces chartreusis NRRL 3882]
MVTQPNDWSGLSWLGPPIDARALFGPELDALLGLLRGLGPTQWARIAVPGWTVHDVAAHVLGDCSARLGRREFGAFAPGETLEAFIHRSNQEWVDRHRDMDPASLVDALEEAGTELARRFAHADLDAPSLGVSWAGADPAPMWLDCAREFTEYWTHRQQIRHAAGLGTDPAPRALSIVLDTFMRALPHTLRDTAAPAGTRVQVTVPGPGGGTWSVTAGAEGWSLAEDPGARPAAAVVELDTETAWQLCTRGVEPATALTRARVDGDRRLAEAVGRIVSIVY